MKSWKTLLLLVLVFLFSCNATSIQDQQKIRRILFVGNSLTYFNNLPELVKENALNSGVDIQVEMIAFPNYALEDHWNDGVIQSEITSDLYDFVVVQQGPSSQEAGRLMLLEYGGYLSEICKNHQTQLCFFMVWPSLTYYSTFEGVIQNYRNAAIESESILIPVGERLMQYIEETGDKNFYGPDRFHPSFEGSEFASKIIWEVLYQHMI